MTKQKTTVNEEKKREPLFHIVKRASVKPWEPYVIRAGAVL